MRPRDLRSWHAVYVKKMVFEIDRRESFITTQATQTGQWSAFLPGSQYTILSYFCLLSITRLCKSRRRKAHRAVVAHCPPHHLQDGGPEQHLPIQIC